MIITLFEVIGKTCATFTWFEDVLNYSIVIFTIALLCSTMGDNIKMVRDFVDVCKCTELKGLW